MKTQMDGLWLVCCSGWGRRGRGEGPGQGRSREVTGGYGGPVFLDIGVGVAAGSARVRPTKPTCTCWAQLRLGCERHGDGGRSSTTWERLPGHSAGNDGALDPAGVAGVCTPRAIAIDAGGNPARVIITGDVPGKAGAGTSSRSATGRTCWTCCGWTGTPTPMRWETRSSGTMCRCRSRLTRAGFFITGTFRGTGPQTAIPRERTTSRFFMGQTASV